MNRRTFFKYGALTVATIPLNKISGSDILTEIRSSKGNLSDMPTCIFVKPLEKYGYENIAVLLSEAGFDGADISFRKGGLIEPDTAKGELPKLIKTFRNRNISIPMAVSGITDPDSSGTEEQLKLMADFGIKHYRLGMIQYNQSKSLVENLEGLKVKMDRLCELNARYGLHGAIQNHVGNGFGAPVWDAYTVIKDCDPQFLGFQYDIRHAVAEGNGSWPLGLDIIANHIHTICIKDFTWVQNENNFKPVSVPLKEGIVDFKKYFAILKNKHVSALASIHYEYPLLTESDSELGINEQMKKIIPVLKQDLDVYKKMQLDYFK